MAETTDASRVRLGRDEALALARKVRRIIVGRGKKAVVLDMKNAPPDDELAALLLGRSGNLKAPTLRIGDTLVVGFSEEGYQQELA